MIQFRITFVSLNWLQSLQIIFWKQWKVYEFSLGSTGKDISRKIFTCWKFFFRLNYFKLSLKFLNVSKPLKSISFLFLYWSRSKVNLRRGKDSKNSYLCHQQMLFVEFSPKTFPYFHVYSNDFRFISLILVWPAPASLHAGSFFMGFCGVSS